MSCKDICISLETAKKFKKNGWNNRATFVYIKEYDEYYLKLLEDISYDNNSNQTDFYYAPTCSEIDLPITFTKDGYTFCLTIFFSDEGILINYKNTKASNVLFDWIEAKTEVEAKAQMWLYLKEKESV